MARIFISHSSANNAEALALRDWLVARGWDDLFLDIDPQRGLVSGQRWLDHLQTCAQRCKAVIFLLSREWLASRYCTAEFWEARKQERPLFAVVIDDTAVSEVPAEMRGVWQLAFLTRGSRFETFSVLPPPDYVPTPVRFSQEGLESLRLGLVQAGLTSFDTASFPWPARGFEHEADGTTPRRPYRGLKPVDVPDAGVFFGRDADLVRARDHLADLRDHGGRCLVVILGASGSGKSSFLRAGLWPRLARDDRRFLPLPVLRPRGAAMWGDEGLLAALETAHRQADLAVTRAELRQDLEAGGAGFLRRLADLRSAAAQGLPKDAKPPTLLLPIDQAEELFTTVRGETGTAEAALFLTHLAEILRHGPEALALVTIRSDAYEPLQTAPALTDVLQVPFNLPPLATSDYRGVIDGPAHRASDAGQPLTLEPGLVAALLADAQGADALPLLGFTLERLYVEHGGDGMLTHADYEALGGVQGSIEAAAAEAFADPDTTPRIPADAAEREALLKRAFVPHLMGVNEANGEPVRRTARRDDLPEASRELIDRLIDRRLLVVDRRFLESGTEETVIEVAHEALLRRWPTLRRWHDQERASLEIQQEIARAASAWSQNGCRADSDWLTHRGTRLAEAEAVACREDFAAVFAGVPRAYLDACRQAEDAARDAEDLRLARQRAMQRRVGVLLIAVAIVTFVGGGLVVAGQRELERQRLSLIAANAKAAFEAGRYDRAMRLALVASQGTWFTPPSVDAEIQLGRAAHFSRLEAQLTGHDGPVNSAAFSPDGTRIVTASEDGTARVWSRGQDDAWHSAALKGHQSDVNSAIFSPDGARIVTASEDNTARVWSRGQNGLWHSAVLKGHQGKVRSAFFSPDGTRVVTASLDGTARLWHTDADGTWRSIILKGHQGAINSATFSPDGTRIVSASWDGTARIWSQGADGTWHSVALKGHQGTVYSAAFTPDSERIVTASEDGTTREWYEGGARVWRSIAFEAHQGPVVSAALSFDGQHIVTTSEDKETDQHPLLGEEDRLVLANESVWSLRVWSRAGESAWQSVVLKGHEGAVNSTAFSLDGAIVSASEDDTALVWSRAEDGTWQRFALEGHQNSVTSAAFSPDGSRIVTASADETARVWNRGNAWAGAALEGSSGRVTSAAFTSDGTRIVATSETGQALVWNRNKGGAWHFLEGHQSSGEPATNPPAEVSIALEAAEDGVIGLWRRSDDTHILLGGHNGWVLSAVFSPDDERIVTVSYPDVALVWSQGEDDVWTSVVMEGHQDWIYSTAFSPDGMRIVTASRDNTARVWSLGDNGDWTSVALRGHKGPVLSAAFSPDGRRIVTASNDGTVRVWNVRWLMGPDDWAKTEPLSLPKTVCLEKFLFPTVTVVDPKTGRYVESIVERLLTAEDIQAAPILAGREGEDVCAPFLEPQPWWSRLAFWR